MRRRFWNRIVAAVNKLIGAIPYSFSAAPHLELTKDNHYRITRESPYILIKVLSLDRTWQTTFKPFKPGWSWKNWLS